MMRGLAEEAQGCRAVGTATQSLVAVDGEERKRKMDLVLTPFFFAGLIEKTMKGIEQPS